MWRFFSLLLCSMLSIGAYATEGATDPLVGDWQTYDDSTGGKRAIIRISYDKKNDAFYGRIIKRNYVSKAGVRTQDTCYKCPKPFTDTKIVGMVTLWGVKKDTKSKAGKRYPYQGGYIIDPSKGNIYGLEMRLSKSGNLLKGRAFLVNMKRIGRQQTWVRIKK